MLSQACYQQVRPFVGNVDRLLLAKNDNAIAAHLRSALRASRDQGISSLGQEQASFGPV